MELCLRDAEGTFEKVSVDPAWSVKQLRWFVGDHPSFKRLVYCDLVYNHNTLENDNAVLSQILEHDDTLLVIQREQTALMRELAASDEEGNIDFVKGQNWNTRKIENVEKAISDVLLGIVQCQQKLREYEIALMNNNRTLRELNDADNKLNNGLIDARTADKIDEMIPVNKRVCRW